VIKYQTRLEVLVLTPYVEAKRRYVLWNENGLAVLGTRNFVRVHTERAQ
jgi:hypothetical protein